MVISSKGREKQITLKGAGMGKTIITDATGPQCFQTVVKSSEQGIYSDVQEKALRITGFTFRGAGGDALISLAGYTSWRVDHCRFENSGRSLWVSGFGLIDAHVASHGTESGGRNRSIRSYEIYANRWHLGQQKERWTAIFLRGGTGVIFDNRVTGRYGSFVLATNYRSSAAYPPWGKCDGSSRWDGNQEPNGYPAIDQIGRSTDSGPGTPQELGPLREWNNTLGGRDADIAVSGTGAVHVHIKQGRDFLNDAPRPGYVPYTYPHPSARQQTAMSVKPPK